jgi:hypothetical protein
MQVHGMNMICNASGKKIARAQINRVRKTFYQECIKEGMDSEDVDVAISMMYTDDSTKDVMAGIKAGKQRRRNIAGKKAAITRRKNALA